MMAAIYPQRRGPIHMVDALSLSLLTLYVAVKDLVIPLVRRNKPSKTAIPETRLRALEIDLRESSVKVISLDKALMGMKDDMDGIATELTETTTAISNKLDLVLDEARETRQHLGERLAKVETHIEHIRESQKPGWKRT